MLLLLGIDFDKEITVQNYHDISGDYKLFKQKRINRFLFAICYRDIIGGG
jgi:hypothetical protein